HHSGPASAYWWCAWAATRRWYRRRGFRGQSWRERRDADFAARGGADRGAADGGVVQTRARWKRVSQKLQDVQARVARVRGSTAAPALVAWRSCGLLPCGGGRYCAGLPLGPRRCAGAGATEAGGCVDARWVPPAVDS